MYTNIIRYKYIYFKYSCFYLDKISKYILATHPVLIFISSNYMSRAELVLTLKILQQQTCLITTVLAVFSLYIL